MIPKVLYVNLDRSIDRKTAFEKQAAERGITAERFSAISSEEIDQYVHGWKSTNLTASEVGCLVSHLEIARLHGNEPMLVFEDDVSFEAMDYWGFSLEDALSVIPKDWSVVQLAVFPPVDTLRYVKWESGRFGTVAYLMRPERAFELVSKAYVDGKWDLHKLPSRYSRPMADSVLYAHTSSYSIPLFGILDVPSVIQYSQPHGHYGKQVVQRWKNSTITLKDL